MFSQTNFNDKSFMILLHSHDIRLKLHDMVELQTLQILQSHHFHLK